MRVNLTGQQLESIHTSIRMDIFHCTQNKIDSNTQSAREYWQEKIDDLRALQTALRAQQTIDY